MVSAKPKILVVDDEPNVLLTMAAILLQEGYDVEEAPSGRAALDALAQRSFDLVLTDLNMPGIDGLAVLEAVQKHAPQTVTLVITGYASVSTALRALQLGAYEYLLKPTEIEDLKQAVRRSLERKRLSEIDTLYRVGQSLGQAPDVPAICGIVADAIRGVLHLKHADIILPGRESDCARPSLADLITRKDVRSELEGGNVITSLTSPPLAAAAAALSCSAIAMVPGLVGRRLVCVLVADNNSQGFDFHASSLRFLQGLASQTALALENVSLIAELRRNNEELAHANAKLRELDRLKSQFLSVATHELRTPLSIILGYTSMLSESLDERLSGEERQSFAESIAASKRLIRLVNSMLDITQIEAGRIALHFERIDLRQAVQQSVAFFGQEAQQRNVTLRTELPMRLPKVQADAERVQQVLINLIGNALKFTPAGGKITVVLRAVVGGNVELEVADTGPGIALEDQALLFQEFTRIGRRSREHGAGLGLAITRRIVEAHGGTVRVQSRPAKGAKFIVSLPAEAAATGKTAVSA
jgi:signal transduction histidine kinase/CheY-like chemotaxis protein